VLIAATLFIASARTAQKRALPTLHRTVASGGPAENKFLFVQSAARCQKMETVSLLVSRASLSNGCICHNIDPLVTRLFLILTSNLQITYSLHCSFHLQFHNILFQFLFTRLFQTLGMRALLRTSYRKPFHF
jgi:hypothetical protein